MNGWFEEKGWKNGIGLNHGGKVKTAFGTVRYVNAIHSSEFPDGAYGGNPGGFVIQTEEGNFYYSGDTALTMDMKLIPMYCKLDFAVLPIGGYFTMDYDDAVIASEFIECEYIVGVHFDTFPPIKIDHAEAMHAFRKSGIELKLPAIGETFMI
jgi:L-ascorbate metabolism protein UlaG (beta-lactamase superfamily)